MFLHKFVGMKIVLKRHMGFYVLQVYVPCIMLVILSWVSFFINREATSDRSCIGEWSRQRISISTSGFNTWGLIFYFALNFSINRDYVCAQFGHVEFRRPQRHTVRAVRYRSRLVPNHVLFVPIRLTTRVHNRSLLYKSKYKNIWLIRDSDLYLFSTSPLPSSIRSATVISYIMLII